MIWVPLMAYISLVLTVYPNKNFFYLCGFSLTFSLLIKLEVQNWSIWQLFSTLNLTFCAFLLLCYIYWPQNSSLAVHNLYYTSLWWKCSGDAVVLTCLQHSILPSLISVPAPISDRQEKYHSALYLIWGKHDT